SSATTSGSAPSSSSARITLATLGGSSGSIEGGKISRPSPTALAAARLTSLNISDPNQRSRVRRAAAMNSCTGPIENTSKCFTGPGTPSNWRTPQTLPAPNPLGCAPPWETPRKWRGPASAPPPARPSEKWSHPRIEVAGPPDQESSTPAPWGTPPGAPRSQTAAQSQDSPFGAIPAFAGDTVRCYSVSRVGL